MHEHLAARRVERAIDELRGGLEVLEDGRDRRVRQPDEERADCVLVPAPLIASLTSGRRATSMGWPWIESTCVMPSTLSHTRSLAFASEPK